MRHRLSDLATPENIYTVQIGSAIGTHVGPGAPIGRLLGAGDLHMVSRAIPGSLAMAVPHRALHLMTLARTMGDDNNAKVQNSRAIAGSVLTGRRRLADDGLASNLRLPATCIA